MNNTRKRVTASLLAFAIVAGTIPANVQWAEVFGGSTIVAQAEPATGHHTTNQLQTLYESAYDWYNNHNGDTGVSGTQEITNLLIALNGAINQINNETPSEERQTEINDAYTALETAFNAAKSLLNVTYKTASWDGAKVIYENATAETYYTVSAYTTAMSNGTYVVKGNIEIADRITVTGTVNLILCDGATLTASEGITVTADNTLNIYGQGNGTGSLIARTSVSEEHAAGIGGLNRENGGNINIYGGEITANSSRYGSGIGGGCYASGGNLTIYGGKVTAIGDSEFDGAGIGGGNKGSGGIVTIYGGDVTAIGGKHGAGIGSGSNTGSGGTITINGGKVTATGGQTGAGIGGGGWGGTGGSVTINGGQVIASGVNGIGCGYNSSDNGTLSINNNKLVLQTSDDNSSWTNTTNTNNRKSWMRTAKKLVAGQFIGVGDIVSVTSGSDNIYTDTSFNIDASKYGNYSLRSDTITYSDYTKSYSFPIYKEGTSNYISIAISSETPLTTAPTGFWVTGGSGTQSDPYTFGLVTRFTTQPSDLSLTYGYTSGSLSVAAVAEEGYVLSYQWYSNTTNSNTGGTAIEGATSASYSIPTGIAVGTTRYYYCVATATKGNNTVTNASNTAKVTVGKKTPTVTAPTASAITYGQTLNDSTLTGGSATGIGGSSINGTFAWKTPTTVPTVSNSGYTVVFTPNDTTNYNTVELTVSPTVNKATPVIFTAPTASAITYGQTLNDSTLTGGSATGVEGTEISGQFSWSDNTIPPTVADSNTTEYNVTFTPNDATNYSTVVCRVKLTVNKADSSATAPTAIQNLGYTGSPKALVTAGTATGGTMYYAVTDNTTSSAPTSDNAWSTTVPSKTDADTYKVWYKVIGDANHNSTQADFISVKINKAAPTVTAPTFASGLSYTGGSQDLITNAGTVTNGTRYFAVTAVTVTDPASIDASSWKTYSSTDTTFKKTDMDTYRVWHKVVGAENHYDIAAVYTDVTISIGSMSADVSAADYNGVFDSSPHGITVTAPTGATVKYCATENGTYTTTPITFTDVTDGAQTVYYKVEKTNYTTVTGSATINITKAAPNVTAPTASAITYGQTLASSTLTGGSATGVEGTEISGQFSWSDNTTAPDVANSNTTEYNVTFTPNEATNYNTASCNVKLTVNKADSSATAPTAIQNLGYTGSPKELVTAGTATGGTMYYAVTDNTVTSAPTSDNAWSTTVPSKTDADTYKVWYKVIGDANHNSTQADFISVRINQAAPTVTAPTAIQSLGYTGSPKKLVTAGTATGGTMYYAVTDNTATSAPTNDSAWSTTVPSKTDAGNYKVWYIVRGDENHTDTVPAYVEASIAPAENPIAFTAAQTVTKSFSESAQTATLTAAANAEGTVTYSIDSQKNSAQTAVSYFSINGSNLSIAANTPIGTYTVAVKASAAGNTNYNSKTATSTVTVTVDKADNSFATAPVLASASMYAGTALSLIITPGTPRFGDADKVSYAVTTTDAAPAADAESWTTYDNIKADAAGTYYVWYKIAEGTDWNAVAATKLGTVTVTNKSEQTWTLSMPDYVYNGTVHTPTLNGTAYGKLTYTYFTSAGVCLGNTAPTEPGDYRVSVSASGDETHFSKLESADYTIKGAKFSTGNTVSFKKIVEFNFFVEATDAETVEGAYVVFTYDHYGTTTTVKKPINKDDKNGKYYRVRLPLTASEMAIDIKAELYLATSDKPVDTRTRSIKDYAEAAIKADLDGADVLKAMLNYGGYTQTALGNNTELLANSGEGIAVDVSSISPKSATAFERPEPYEGAQRTSIGGIPENVNIKFTPKVTYMGSTVITKSDVYVRHYFEVDPSLSSAELEKVMVQVGYNIPVPITRLRKNSTGYYYDTAPQLAYELDKENKSILVFGFAGSVTNIEAYTEVDGNSVASGAKIIEITPAENSSYSLYSIYIENYSVIDYCEAVANSNKQTAASKNMVKALYSYYMAAKAYVDMRA